MKTQKLTAFSKYTLCLVALLACFQFGRAQVIDFGKSYINVTKGIGGGTVEPGDTLEIRASIVVRSGTFDSCAYFDAIPAGTAYIPGTIRVLTNEGKIYKQFTDPAGDDQGNIIGSNIRINLGYNGAAAPSNAFRRGRIANNHRPSFYNSACIMIASFRVRVTASYGTVLSIGGGSMSYRPSGGSLTSHVFPLRRVSVYLNVGICPNAIGANSIGTESNGTFGSGRPRNRGASANVPAGYTYLSFTSGTPNDYGYGIPNNTSINTGYTTSNTWPKPDGTRRVFGVWDIIGDHTGAADPLMGNPAADTVNNANGGYMLVINAAYRIDSAFQQTISGLCPNTYYEISLWMRNICSRCGCDSTGRGAGSAGYLPTAPGDSSGVYPNLSFNVNGIDYYTTGNIQYTGRWIKKGFTYLTGPSQTSFTLKVYNNAPGGGGNDWALDDISVATCGPNLTFTPNPNPTVCEGNVAELGANITSYFDNYTYYKWQRSTDNGATWTDVSTVGMGSPTWNGSAWEYGTSYTPFVANASDSGNRYRVVVGSTASNITNASCSFADTSSVLTLNVINCGWSLSTDLLSFNGKRIEGLAQLSWTTSAEDGPISFAIERSTDGQHFVRVALVPGYNNGAASNAYQWSEAALRVTAFYRVRMLSSGTQKASRIISLAAADASPFTVKNVQNPFSGTLSLTMQLQRSSQVSVQVIDGAGRTIFSKAYRMNSGDQTVLIEEGASWPKGVYTLWVQAGREEYRKKLIKQ